ncbi:hypothetical protein FHS59_003891 [Algoriphagus iocasae]|uniref:Putative carbohydrate metabolism domain-containing protein n=1 Tax=Algoriphagus iocasae TaxID=1836499 RepID=A0A841N021_9BACT|nr:PCMD domain-containing protein [Algoriphagus iocasae]MBB6328248.1 hypothetical protein [Algoriphagus iocasae]
MKNIIALICTAFLLQSCIKEEPKNPEADILSFQLDESLLTGKTVINQSNNTIQLFLTGEAFDSGVAPIIEISPNASISPNSLDSIHFDNGPVEYVVTSQAGFNKKTYTVEVANVGNWTFDFEDWKAHPDDKYEYPFESNGSEIWTSGNPGVALSGIPKIASAYPTRSTTDAYSGSKAAEIVTIPGTELSEFLGIYLYAGSLFMGDFNSSVVLINPLSATEFGEPYIGTPDRFVGYYKYTPGNTFQDENKNPVSGKVDECSLYAVLFTGPERLNGSNINTSDKVIATAKLPDGSARAEYTKFDIPFIYKADWDSTATNLMVAIVASSSSEGDRYRGALGSRLVVDSLAIVPR